MENKKNIGWGFENKEDDNYGILIICYFSIFISGSLLFLICLYIYCTMRKKKNDRKIKNNEVKQIKLEIKNEKLDEMDKIQKDIKQEEFFEIKEIKQEKKNYETTEIKDDFSKIELRRSYPISREISFNF